MYICIQPANKIKLIFFHKKQYNNFKLFLVMVCEHKFSLGGYDFNYHIGYLIKKRLSR